MTMVLPPARAGPIFQACISSGKFLWYTLLDESRGSHHHALTAFQSRYIAARHSTLTHCESQSEGALRHACTWLMRVMRGVAHHGMICPTTPSGSLSVYTCILPSVGRVWPA